MKSFMAMDQLRHLLVSAFALVTVLIVQTAGGLSLEAGFQDPPHSARPATYWLWLNGYVNRDHLDEELKAFADHGIGGLCLFDMGARGNKAFQPPAGPAFMDEEFLDNLALTNALAQKYGLDIQLAACSSWDLGGAWVEAKYASMGLYHSTTHVTGPTTYRIVAKSPIASSVDHGPLGPQWYRNVATLAIPEVKRQPAHEFVFKLPRGTIHQVDHAVLYNAIAEGAQGAFATASPKGFSVAVSVEDPREEDFRELVRATLTGTTEGQRFDFPETGARYVRLRVFANEDSNDRTVFLGEFELYDTQGNNVAGSIEIDRTKDSAEIIWCNSDSYKGRRWAASNIHDGIKAGNRGIWAGSSPLPLLIEDRSQIIDLTERSDEWHVPEGDWTVINFYYTNTGERLKVPSPRSDGLATDHFNSTATRIFLETLTRRLEGKLGDLRQTQFKQLYLPSYEVVGAKWTPDFLDQFRKYRHYGMTPFLPVLAGHKVESDEVTLRFLYDYRKTLGDLLVDAYYRTANEIARKAGLGVEAEAGGPGPPVHQVPVDALKALGAIDEMRGEFWPWRQDRNQLWVVKETACAAHVYGRRRVSMEAFTGFRHWEDGPFDLKPAADRAFCEGMNRVVWHTASHQPPEAGKPGWVYGAGTHLTPNLVWWPMAKPFISYLSRCSYLLQQGLFVGDVCYYYGDQGYNFVPPKHVDPSLGPGYDYDVANPEVILNRMQVRDGRIALPDGMQYELLVLPDREDCDIDVLRRIGELVEAGATVVGPKPIRANGLTEYPRRDQEVKTLADRIWGDCDGQEILEHQHGKGRVIHGRSLREILSERGIGPDFQFANDSAETRLDYIHRRTSQTDIYFVRNETDQPTEVTATFRVSRGAPELWDPVSGRIDRPAFYTFTDQGTELPLSFDAYGSTFVVFRPAFRAPPLRSHSPGLQAKLTGKHQVLVTATAEGSYQLETAYNHRLTLDIDALPLPKELTGPWQVEFTPGWGAPATVTLPALKSWTEHNDIGIKHYSGIARYEIRFDLPSDWLGPDRQIYLDLGRLWAVGKVTLNDKALGVVWAPPYRLAIGSVAHKGENRLQIEIANTWSNRLVGDTQLSPEDRFCQTNIQVSGTPGRPWQEVPLRESGLLGPVQLIPAIEKTIASAMRKAATLH